MIAVCVHAEIVLAGVAIPEHRTLAVADEGELFEADGERSVLTIGEARALVQAGYADAIEANFDELPDLIDGWERV
jgi:hypothetical protein